MAARKPLFMGTEGYSEEMATSDSITLGGLTMGGNIAMGGNKVTGAGAATTSGDLLAYGQSGGSLAGLTLTGNLSLSGTSKVTDSVAPTAAGDLTNKSYVDQMVATGTQIKESVLTNDQFSDPQGLLAAEVLYFSNQPLVGDSVTVKNGTLTRTYTFVADIASESAATDVSRESSAQTALARLALRANADVGNTQWHFDDDDNTFRFTPTPPGGLTINVIEKTAPASTAPSSRIYGTFTTANDARVVEFQAGGVTDVNGYARTASVTMPVADPGEGRFGFRRTAADLVDGELHYEHHFDTIYGWNSDLQTWVIFSGSGAVPDATSGAGGATKGKITVDEDYALYVSTGILRMALSTTGALQFVAGTPKTLAVKVEANKGLTTGANGLATVIEPNTGLTVGASGLAGVADTTQGISVGANGFAVALAANPGLEFAGGLLQAKLNSAGGLQKDANGISIKTDETPDTLDVDGDGLKVVGLPSLFKVNGTAVGATVTATAFDTLTNGSNADALHVHAAATATEAPKVENTLPVVEAVAIGDPVYQSATNNQVGKADTTDAKAKVLGIARTAQGTPGGTAEVTTAGIATNVLSGAVAGTAYYLATGGGISTALPGAGQRVIQVGIATNATDLFVRVTDYGKKAA